MPTLLELQRDFARSVLTRDDAVCDHVVGGNLAPSERVGIYRNTSRIVLTEALRLGFPAVDALVGGEFFDMAAARFLRDRPPSSGCLNDYGEEFAAFLDDLPEAAGVPYLGDVARFERALSVAATAPDPNGTEPDASLGLLHLAHPADAIADAVLSADPDVIEALDPWAGPVWLVVHRGLDGIRSQRLDAERFAVLRALLPAACSPPARGST